MPRYKNDFDEKPNYPVWLFCWCAEHGVDLGGESPLRAQSSENR
ncbi:hypothetical protein VIBHAR_06612 [Vibrio campbellii ATCC BAA-1116]|uniref:Uncharacterized protein n=1 Tax=Vibrio campbellii (strain ATCC BAA-1116) TaxID=2902295 RepID=A7N2J9_VIBC1|nr:hypothetical protein VIBHAR_06612 [Vibrio campbellii ATCC BAA-1116]